MIYNLNDTKISKFIKLSIFWISLIAMFLIFTKIIKYDIKPPQKQTSIAIDIKNKVNICLPKKEDEFELN